MRPTVADPEESVEPGITVQGSAYACVPVWVLEADISSSARLLYVGLNSYVAGTGGSCTVRRETLTRRTGLSVATIGRAVRELEQIGALRVHGRVSKDGKRRANAYTLLFDSPDVRAADVAPAAAASGAAPAAPSAPSPAPAPSGGQPTHPEWLRYRGIFVGELGKKVTSFSAAAWERFVKAEGASKIKERATLAADCAEQYVKDLRRDRRGFDAVKQYAKSAEAFLSESEWEKHQPRPEPEEGHPVVDDWTYVAQASAPGERSFEERHALYAAAAAGDERAIGKLRRRLPARGFEAPDGVPARWPELIGVLGLRLPFYASDEDRAAFAACEGAAGGPVVADEAVEEASGSSATDFERVMSGEALAYDGQDPLEAALPAAEVSGGPVIWSETTPVEAAEGSSEAPAETAGGESADWPIEAVGEPSEAYSEAVSEAWRPAVAPPAPDPEGSPDVPAVDDSWGIGAAEAAARVAPYAPLGSAEDFRDRLTMLADHDMRHRGEGGVEGQEELF